MIRIRYTSRQYLMVIGTSGWMNRNYTTLGITQHTLGRIRIQHGCSELFGLIGSELRVPALFLCRGSGSGFNPYNCSYLYLCHVILFGGLMKGKHCLPNVLQRDFYFFQLNIFSTLSCSQWIRYEHSNKRYEPITAPERTIRLVI